MPIAWTKTYQIPGGQKGKAFTSTIGAATDILNESVRRLLINGVFWTMDCWYLKMANGVPSRKLQSHLLSDLKKMNTGRIRIWKSLVLNNPKKYFFNIVLFLFKCTVSIKIVLDNFYFAIQIPKALSFISSKTLNHFSRN